MMRKILIRILLRSDRLIQGTEDLLIELRVKIFEMVWFIVETSRRDASKAS